MSISKGVALITGSAQGIGRAIALRLAKDGFDVALNDVLSKREQLRTVAEDINKLGRKTCLAMADVTDEEQVRAMVDDVAKELGGLDVMVANAGIFEGLQPIVSTELDVWERVMAVNARGTFLCYKHAAAQMIKQGRGGRLIAASSFLGKAATPSVCAYAASKFAIRGLTQTAALELGRYGITANSYAPGFIQTQMSESYSRFRNDLYACLASSSGRRQPEEVAGVVSYLASKEAQFVTGEHLAAFHSALQISIDGGRLLS
ncbi:hypothetical protein F5I97DRAFT_1933803 [Phlebopus sp. FC_14]|nr:hypothetical protein F5I97DRAFT_1933803 [Phlebopus sp. FC_14]